MTDNELSRWLDALSPDVKKLNPDLTETDANTSHRSNAEHEMQVALFQWIRAQRNIYFELHMAFAVPNGGHRHPATAARMKAEGVEAGVPDVILLYPNRSYHGAAWELKVGGNKPTDKQKWWLRELACNRYYINIIYDDWQAVANDMLWYLGYEDRIQ